MYQVYQAGPEKRRNGSAKHAEPFLRVSGQGWYDTDMEELLKYRILHELSFHMKFMKQAFGEFYKFHLK